MTAVAAFDNTPVSHDRRGAQPHERGHRLSGFHAEALSDRKHLAVVADQLDNVRAAFDRVKAKRTIFSVTLLRLDSARLRVSQSNLWHSGRA